MSHYAIGLFLEATTRMVLHDRLEAKHGPLALSEPPIMQWRHLDTLGSKTMVGQKRPRLDGGDTDSGCQETFSNKSEMDGEDEEEDEEVKVITATPLRVLWLTLSVTAHLVQVGTHGIPGFG